MFDIFLYFYASHGDQNSACVISLTYAVISMRAKLPVRLLCVPIYFILDYIGDWLIRSMQGPQKGISISNLVDSFYFLTTPQNRLCTFKFHEITIGESVSTALISD